MNYHDITTDDMKNGDGLRTVLWAAGCSHQCQGCHNPVTWDGADGLPFDENAWQELCKKLSKEHISGLTLSGGDPLYSPNREAVARLAKRFKNIFPNKNLWLYTGYTWEEIQNLSLLLYIDVLVDGKFIESQKDTTLHWKGSANQRVIDVAKSLTANTIILYK